MSAAFRWLFSACCGAALLAAGGDSLTPVLADIVMTDRRSEIALARRVLDARG